MRLGLAEKRPTGPRFQKTTWRCLKIGHVSKQSCFKWKHETEFGGCPVFRPTSIASPDRQGLFETPGWDGWGGSRWRDGNVGRLGFPVASLGWLHGQRQEDHSMCECSRPHTMNILALLDLISWWYPRKSSFPPCNMCGWICQHISVEPPKSHKLMDRLDFVPDQLHSRGKQLTIWV